ncbi:MAG: S8 family serine peptidase [Fimbriimonadales bacterium]|nr:S8 family serine peptidase [Fimbriimonadales bacterium]
MRQQLRWWLLGLIITTATMGAWAQRVTVEDFVPGEMLIRLRPGGTVDTARVLAQRVNAEAIPIAVRDTYVFRLKATQGKSRQELVDWAHKTANELGKDPQVLYAEPHWRARLFAEPNDPLLSQQWALRQIKAFAAWDVEKGKPGIRIAIIDDNFQRSHPDLQSRFDPLSRNFVADPPNDNIDPEGGFSPSHGTAVMGVAAAATNNGIGIAGLCWEGVTVVALKTTASTDGFLDGANILEAMQYVVDNASQIHVVNMSFGSYSPSPQQESLIREMYRRGVVPVAAAGNDAVDIPSYPANYQYVVNVSATGPTGEPAEYTNYTGITVAAPGGDFNYGLQGGVLSTSSTSQQYTYENGTSLASPYVAAAVALLLSAGVPRHSGEVQEPPVVTILKETADPRGRRVPDPYLGAGIINMEDAMRGQGKPTVAFDQPVAGTITDTRAVRVRVIVRRVRDNSVENILNVRLNGQPLERSLWANSAAVDTTQRVIVLDFEITVPAEGRYEIVVEAVGDQGEVARGTTSFNVRPQVFQPGVQMVAIPYAVDRRPEEVFGVEAVLARYLPEQGVYARYTASNPDPRAGFNPPGLAVRPQGTDIPTPPRGVGYFLYARSSAAVLGGSLVDTNRAYLIPLQEGWNMIGNPFPFNVPWGACEVEIFGAGGQVQRLSMQEATEREIIRPQIYRYLPLTGAYTWRTAPLGELLAWQAHWVKALKPCTLVVPPVGSLRSRSEDAPARVQPAAGSGWLLRLTARSGNREDQNLFIGVDPTARDEVGREDVEKPPAFQSYLALQLNHPRTRTALAQDLRSSARRAQRWEVSVETDAPDSEVTLQWSQERAVPKGVRLTLIDAVSGARVNMLQQSSYQFRVGSETRRQLIIEATPSRASQLRITSVSATPTRSGEFAIQYALSDEATVSVIVRDASGRVIRQLQQSQSRSRGAHTTTWNGRTDAGVAVPPGTYQVQITATSDTGEVARTALPIVLTR